MRLFAVDFFARPLGAFILVLCDTRDTSILIVDTYVTIPVSPRSRYTTVYRGRKKYRYTAQVSRVSTIPYGSDHWTTSRMQAYDAKTNVIKSQRSNDCSIHIAQAAVTQSPSTTTLPISGQYCYQGRTDSSRTKTRTRSHRTQMSKTCVDLKI